MSNYRIVKRKTFDGEIFIPQFFQDDEWVDINQYLISPDSIESAKKIIERYKFNQLESQEEVVWEE